MDRERRWVAATWVAIALLVVIGLGTSVASSLGSFSPEITVETCSLLAALMLVIAERLAAHHATRRASVVCIAQELHSNALALCTGIWVMDKPTVAHELRDLEGGLRLYYPQLGTAAVTAAILGTAFDAARDFELVAALHDWRANAAACNTRLTMGQLLLFFSPATREGLAERLRVHASMAAVTVAEARIQLETVIGQLAEWGGRGPVSRHAHTELVEARRLLEDIALSDPTTDELRALTGEKV